MMIGTSQVAPSHATAIPAALVTAAYAQENRKYRPIKARRRMVAVAISVDLAGIGMSRGANGIASTGNVHAMSTIGHATGRRIGYGSFNAT